MDTVGAHNFDAKTLPPDERISLIYDTVQACYLFK